ncbi:MAG: uracil-DNA glycosylase [Polymorphobacter sp.]
MEIDPTAPALPWPGYTPTPGDAPRDCALCPRLAALRADAAEKHPDWWNAPVPGFGDPAAWLAVVGLAPGMKGANRTGRPFTGDHAGTLLYATLAKFGLLRGDYAAASDDGITLNGVFITNAVRCVPPGNKPDTAEIHACRPFLVEHLRGLPQLKIIIALGGTAHQSAVKALGGKLPKTPFGHGAVHALYTGYTIIDSYHCSQLNTNTGRLTTDMFESVFAQALATR